MKFCCEKFKTHWQLPKQGHPNIRIVKYVSEFLNKGYVEFEGTKIKTNKKFKLPYRFYITWGYEKDFSIEMIYLFIEYCPFCGADLYKFYQSDEYANEIEGKTFKL